MDAIVSALRKALTPGPSPALRARGAGGTRVRCGGFTLIELVVTLTLVSVLAMVAVPLYEVTVTHSKESELRSALREIRTALDAYKAAADSGVISKGSADSGYPPTLKTLVEGVDTIASPVTGANPAAGNGGIAPIAPSSFGSGSGSGGSAQNPSANNSPDAIPTHMVFMRQIPRDPFFEDQSVAPDQQWNVRAYGNLPDDYSAGADVYDVATKSTATGLNGVAYKDW